MLCSFPEWVTILCLEDHKVYTCGLKALEREDGLEITDDDLMPGNRLIWHCRGVPYEVEVMKVKGKRMVHCENGACKIASNFTISASTYTHCN